MNAQPLAYLYLSQIPYTGLELGPIGTAFYWLILIAWAFALAYFALFSVAPFVYRSTRSFSARVTESLNASSSGPAPAGPRSHVAARVPEAPKAPVVEHTHSYSPYEGFKSFARDGALSVEDIVKGLSRIPAPKPSIRAAEPIHNVEPIYEHVEPIAPAAASTSGVSPHVSARNLVSALVQGDRSAVFESLRQCVRDGKSPERFISDAVRVLDDAYRARIDGTSSDADIARLVARLETPTLEQLVSALSTAVDTSYSTGAIGAKLALIRALAVLGA